MNPVYVQRKRLARSKGSNRVGVSHLSSEGGDRFSFRNVVFLRIPDDRKNPKLINSIRTLYKQP
jgi:hypothetical protein